MGIITSFLNLIFNHYDPHIEESHLFSGLDSIIDDIVFINNYSKSVIWSHVKRDGNIVAHHLAKLVPISVEEVWEHCCPS